MADMETVIKAFEYLNWYFTQDDGTADENAVKAWEVLSREQEPVKPEFDPLDGNVGRWRCGSCHISLGAVRPPYCWHCGKRVKWDD